MFKIFIYFTLDRSYKLFLKKIFGQNNKHKNLSVTNYKFTQIKGCVKKKMKGVIKREEKAILNVI
jgi:hypothetical protein